MVVVDSEIEKLFLNMLNMTIEDVVSEQHVSVRLRRCVKNPNFPFKTIGHFVKYEDISLPLLKDVRNVGSKTIDELSLLIDKNLKQFVHDNIPSLSNKSVVEYRKITKKIIGEKFSLQIAEAFQKKVTWDMYSPVLEFFNDVPFSKTVSAFNASKRLSESLHILSEISSLKDYIVNYNDYSAYLLSHHNFGKKTLCDLNVIINSIMQAYIRASIGTKYKLESLTLQNLVSGKVDNRIFERLIKVGDIKITDFKDIEYLLNASCKLQTKPVEILTLQKEILEIISTLEKSYLKILTLRYGLDGKGKSTLKEVGEKLGEKGCTREAVRQMVNNALERLRKRKNSLIFESLIFQRESQLLSGLQSEDGVLSDKEFKIIKSNCDGFDALSIDVLYGSIIGWLESKATKIPGGWLNNDVPVIDLKRDNAEFNDYLEKNMLPFHVDDMLYETGIEKIGLKRILKINNGLHQYKGFITRKLSQELVAIKVYNILESRTGSKCMECRMILNEYLEIYPEETINAKYIEAVLRKYSHLAINIFDRIWISIPSVIEDPYKEKKLYEEPFIYPDDNENLTDHNDSNISIWLNDMFKENGALTVQEICKIAEKNTNLSFSINSIAPTIIQIDTYILLLPKYYCLL
jgi:hypothetical protein